MFGFSGNVQKINCNQFLSETEQKTDVNNVLFLKFIKKNTTDLKNLNFDQNISIFNLGVIDKINAIF